jgi:hypothetical protein
MRHFILTLAQSLVATTALVSTGMPQEDGKEKTGAVEKETSATSQVAFLGPEGMVVQWDVPGDGKGESKKLTAPGRENFRRETTYRLKLTGIPGKPGLELYPSLKVRATVLRTEAFLKHNSIPVQLTQEDLDHAMRGNAVTKVIYLPAPEFQELALAGVETLVSTRLDAGADPVVEAERRGAILAIVRLSKDAPKMPDPRRQVEIKDAKGQRMPVLGPYQEGIAEPAAVGPPSEDEVTRTLARARPVKADWPVPRVIERINVRIVVEPVADFIDKEPRHMPLIGPCQVHHAQYKCIIHFTEVTRVGGPIPYTTTDEDCVEVVYIDHSHLHMVGNADPVEPKDEKKADNGEKPKPQIGGH